MRKTTEKSVEVNVLRHLANCLEQRTGNQITVLSPTQNLELRVGYDDIIHGLPPGWVIALQFKRPEELNDDFARFVLDMRQLDVLIRLFPIHHAFYIFSPFPTHLEFIHAQRNILQRTYAVDVHDFSRHAPRNRVSSMVKVHKRRNEISFSVNRNLHPLNAFDVETFCQSFARHTIGSRTRHFFGDYKEDNYKKYYYEKTRKKSKILKNFHFMHISRRHTTHN